MLQFDALHLAIFGAVSQAYDGAFGGSPSQVLRKNCANPVILLVKLVGRPKPGRFGPSFQVQASQSQLANQLGGMYRSKT